jgi:hypothetical protein
VTDELEDDEVAIYGESVGYVPCDDQAAADDPPAPDDVAVTGQGEGYVAVGESPSDEPPVPDDVAIFGESVGYVPNPCEDCGPDGGTYAIFDSFTRTVAAGNYPDSGWEVCDAGYRWTTSGSSNGSEAFVDGTLGHLVSHAHPGFPSVETGHEFAEMVPANFPPGITLPAVVRFDIVSLGNAVSGFYYGSVDFFLEGTDAPAPLLHFYMSIDDPAEGPASAVDTGFSGFDFGTTPPTALSVRDVGPDLAGFSGTVTVILDLDGVTVSAGGTSYDKLAWGGPTPVVLPAGYTLTSMDLACFGESALVIDKIRIKDSLTFGTLCS